MTNTTFTVTEGDGAFVEVCVRVFNGQLERDAILTLQTVDGSAVSQGPEPDYQSLSVQLTFTPSMTEICHNVIIIDDSITENSKLFAGLLSSIDSAVILAPDTASVEILDNDRELPAIFGYHNV